MPSKDFKRYKTRISV